MCKQRMITYARIVTTNRMKSALVKKRELRKISLQFLGFKSRLGSDALNNQLFSWVLRCLEAGL